MRYIPFETVKQKVKEACIEANLILGKDVLEAFRHGLATEESPLGKEVLEQLIENARIAKEEKFPICQDTGSPFSSWKWAIRSPSKAACSPMPSMKG